MKAAVLLVGCCCSVVAHGWLLLSRGEPRLHRCRPLGATKATRPDWQADSAQYGRGDRHLSAILQEGDVVAYQTGSWYVDGVLVGPEPTPSLAYAVVDTLQVVWTHNCEHGVIRAWQLVEPDNSNNNNNSILQNQQQDLVEFGPEQLIARIPVEWIRNGDACRPLVPLGEELWQQHVRLLQK